MKEFISLNGTAPRATKTKRCQAKGCVKLGNLKFKGQWSYLICTEHERLLSDADKKYIAHTVGTKTK